MKKAVAISRADLLRVMLLAPPGQSIAAGLLGFDRRPVPPLQEQPDEAHDSRVEKGQAEGSTTKDPVPAQDYPKPVFGERRLQFLVPVSMQRLQDPGQDPVAGVEPLALEDVSQPPGAEPLAPASLVPWSRLAVFMRRRIGAVLPGRRLDHRRLVRLITSGRPWRKLPQVTRATWGHTACVLWDTGPEMEPFQPDVAACLRRLKRERGRHGLRILRYHGPPAKLPVLPAQSPVLVFSAMGQSLGDPAVFFAWAALGRTLAHAGHPLTVLAPCPRRLWQPVIVASWPQVVWDRHPRLPRRVGTCSAIFRLASAVAAASSDKHVSPAAEQLLTLLCSAPLVTPGLLREARLALGGDADVGCESEVWFHPHTTGEDSVRYFSFRPGPDLHSRLARRREMASEPSTAALVASMDSLIQKHLHPHCSPVVARMADLASALSGAGDPASYAAWLERMVQKLRLLADEPGSLAGLRLGLAAWLEDQVESWFSPEMRAHPAVAPLLARAFALARKFQGTLQCAWPARLDTASALDEVRRHSLRRPSAPVREYALGFQGERVVADPEISAGTAGLAQVLGSFEAAQEWLSIASPGEAEEMVGLQTSAATTLMADLPASHLVLETDSSRVLLKPLLRPPWARRMWYEREGLRASAMLDGTDYLFGWTLGGYRPWPLLGGGPPYGEGRWKLLQPPPKWAEVFEIDEFGLRAEFRIGSVPFVLRWIPPGRFLMGSPEDEPGRRANEGPRHEVRITRGFWLGETPVTQAQWRAVVQAAETLPVAALRRLGEAQKLAPAPSHFQGPSELPVESVSWKDSATFCRCLDALLPDGPGFHLPTEAQWEYACRAGTETALYTGDIGIRRGTDAPALDPVGWYGGNSGNDLEVTSMVGSEGWPRKQYPFGYAGTHRVKLKQANAWGLHDMHGNVGEWCRDAWDEQAYSERQGGVCDPEVKSNEEGVSRALRSGSWGDPALNCRAAARYSDRPGSRGRDLGLRLSAGQEFQAAATE